MAGAVGWILGRLALVMVPLRCLVLCARPIAWGFSLVTASVFALHSGFPASTRRALVMLGCLALFRLLSRNPSWSTGFMLALVLVVLADPLSVLMPGFWLSFAAAGALLVGFRWHRGRTGRLAVLSRAQVSVLLVTVPLGLAWFQHAAPAGFLANLFAIPWVSITVMPAVVAAMLIQGIHGQWAAFLVLLAAEAVAILDALLDWLRLLPWFTARHTHTPASWLLLPATAGALLLISLRCVPQRIVGLALMLPLLVPAGRKPDLVEIELLDTGQGFASTVREGSRLLLYDTGPGDGAEWSLVRPVIVPALAGLQPDTVLISHGDLDHAGGYQDLQRWFPDSRFVGSLPENPEGTDRCTAGLTWAWQAAGFRILHPSRGLPYLGNDSSCVLQVRAHGRSVLFTGDISHTVEQRLLLHGIAKQDVVMVAHHGSRSSSTSAFARRTAPRWALVSAGHGNRFGFPAERVRQVYTEQGSRFASTSDCGGMRVVIDDTGHIRMRSARRVRAAPWRWPAKRSCP